MGLLKNAYRALFGKDDRTIWYEFSELNEGTYVDKNESVEIIYCGHAIRFDTYSYFNNVDTSFTDYTRVRMEFTSSEKFSLRLMKGHFADTIGKLFGAQDIKIGDPEFDRKFVIKGNDVMKTQLIFSKEELRKLILEQKDIMLYILGEGIFGEKPHEGNLILYYISREKITQLYQLENLFEIYQLLLDQLKRSAVIA